MYFFIQFIIGILIGALTFRIINLIEDMCKVDESERDTVKHKLWGSIFGIAITLIISSALLTVQVVGLHDKKINERISAIEMTINEK